MSYHKCNVPGCETRLSEGSPSFCHKHNEPSEDWSESKIRQFREWAQEYLDGERWAGFDYFTAIRTELLERDAELKTLNAKVSEQQRNARRLEGTLESISAVLNQPERFAGINNMDEARLYDLAQAIRWDCIFAVNAATAAITNTTTP